MQIRHYYIAIMLIITISSCNTTNTATNADLPNKYVNAFIGTDEHGHTYPGAQLPFGMVQLSPDNGQSGWNWVSGYHYSDSIIVGFSHTHLSGAGIGDLQDISLMPTIADFDINTLYKQRDDKPYAAYYTHNDELAEPGYYSVNFKETGIKAELTATPRTGFHKYSFSKGSNRNIVLDLGYAVNWDASTETEIEYIDAHTIIGKRYSTGWAKDQRVYFCAKFSEPIQDVISTGNINIAKNKKATGKAINTLFKFNQDINEILVKVSISSVSKEGAIANLQTENQAWDFNAARTQAANIWTESLSNITVEGEDIDKKTVFYTALYRSKLAPTLSSDVDSQYRGGDIKVHKADGRNHYSGLSLWDVFRAQNPLLTITNPDVAIDIANTMLAHYDETGILPVWVLAGNETNTMTGYHSVSMLAEVIMKNLPGIDTERAFQAMKATMMQDQRGLKELREHNYIPYNLMDESVTISLELAYNDYGVAMVANKLGYTDDYNYFLNRSMAYQHLFDGRVGFMRGKDSNGNWRENFDPKHSAHRVGTDYTEGNAWQHSWFVLHDIQGLVNQFENEDAFEKQLTLLFNESSEITGEDASPDITGMIGQYAHGNEPSHHIAYMYNYIGQAWKTQELVHQIMREQYPNSPDGISGNEDMGQMSAWYVLSGLGFYPVNPTDGNFIIGTPLFAKSCINLQGNKQFVISTENHSDKNFYIQSASLNGKELNRSYISYEEIMNGGELHFVMGNKPNKEWASEVNSRPPSVSNLNN
ncbi:GH92 family glycosyl hydrolase [Saccharicrinis aurantiacus]|uniref:GH92 family glycosyl hydrolase n=1 Tax=Saccharicrinis aurantiacus TaxID=1849719 RepID=UPI000839A72B|nr:GH92 family glycosyl hydrolase [Saccharicrinis aurantiacus]